MKTFKRILRALLVFGVLAYLLIAGGPAFGIMISTWTIMIPALFLLAILVLAIWKIGDLVRR